MSDERAVYRIDGQRPTPLPVTTPETPNGDELKSFLLVLYRSLKMLTAYLEKRYHF